MSVMFNQECSLNQCKKQSDIQNVTHVTHHKKSVSDTPENVTVMSLRQNSCSCSDKMTFSKNTECHSKNTTNYLINHLKNKISQSDITGRMSLNVTVQNYKNIITKNAYYSDILSDIQEMLFVTLGQSRKKVSDTTPIYIDIYRGYKDPPNISIYMNGKKLGRPTQKNSEKKSAEKIKNSVCKNFSLMITCGGHHAV